MKTLVSIIVPVFNAEKYIQESIQSILNQTLKDIEIIVVNDGSTDNTAIILNNYCEIDSRIKVFHQQNKGVSATRNVGLDMAKGEYIGFIDPDDWVDIDMYEHLYYQCKRYDLEMSMCNFIQEDIYKNIKVKNEHPIEYGMYLSKNEIIHKICTNMVRGKIFTSVCDKIYRKDFLDEYNIRFDEEVTIKEDYFFNLELYDKLSRCAYINKEYYHYRQVEGSAIRRYHYNSIFSNNKLIKSILTYSKQWGIYEKYKFEISNLIANTYFTSLVNINNKLYKKDKRKKIMKDILNSNILKESLIILSKEDREFNLKQKMIIFILKIKINLIFKIIYIRKPRM